jgi:hypothetical protein
MATASRQAATRQAIGMMNRDFKNIAFPTLTDLNRECTLMDANQKTMD